MPDSVREVRRRYGKVIVGMGDNGAPMLLDYATGAPIFFLDVRGQLFLPFSYGSGILHASTGDLRHSTPYSCDGEPVKMFNGVSSILLDLTDSLSTRFRVVGSKNSEYFIIRSYKSALSRKRAGTPYELLSVTVLESALALTKQCQGELASGHVQSHYYTYLANEIHTWRQASFGGKRVSYGGMLLAEERLSAYAESRPMQSLDTWINFFAAKPDLSREVHKNLSANSCWLNVRSHRGVLPCSCSGLVSHDAGSLSDLDDFVFQLLTRYPALEALVMPYKHQPTKQSYFAIGTRAVRDVFASAHGINEGDDTFCLIQSDPLSGAEDALSEASKLVSLMGRELGIVDSRRCPFSLPNLLLQVEPYVPYIISACHITADNVAVYIGVAPCTRTSFARSDYGARTRLELLSMKICEEQITKAVTLYSTFKGWTLGLPCSKREAIVMVLTLNSFFLKDVAFSEPVEDFYIVRIYNKEVHQLFTSPLTST